MNVLADLWEVANRVDQALPRVTRMRARKADPLDARNVVDVCEEVGEITAGFVRRRVVIDDLPEKLNLFPPGRNSLTDVGQDVGLGPHALVPSRVRHDAEGAVIVAALD